MTANLPYVNLLVMVSVFNPSQAKLLANFCADLAKVLILAGVSAPFISREVLPLRMMLTLLNSIMAGGLLMIAVDLLKGVQK